jgi:hypothetical protein
MIAKVKSGTGNRLGGPNSKKENLEIQADGLRKLRASEQCSERSQDKSSMSPEKTGSNA